MRRFEQVVRRRSPTRLRYHGRVRATAGRLLLFVVVAGAAAALTMRAAAQQPVKDDRPFSSGVEITSVTATVTDKDGRLVHDLPRDAFEIFEDGSRQTITQFTRDRVPVGLGVLLD